MHKIILLQCLRHKWCKEARYKIVYCCRIKITYIRYTGCFVLLPVAGNIARCRNVKLLSQKQNTKNATIDHKFVASNF
jgi:hypothetical protein